MRRIVLSLVVLVGAVAAAKDHEVRGYVKKDGTYVEPHHRTDPNSTKSDNYSTEGNTNPYTGEKGTKRADSNSSTEQ